MTRSYTIAPDASPYTEQEERDRQDFKQAYIDDYGITSKSDLKVLELASREFIKAQRLQLQELTSGHILGNLRWHPLSELRGLLNMMDATRAAKLRGKQPANDNENTMRDFLMSISDIPARSNGHA